MLFLSRSTLSLLIYLTGMLCTAFAAPSGLPSAGTLKNAEGEVWYGVYMFGKKAGYSSAQFTVMKDHYLLTNTLRLEIDTLGSRQIVQTTGALRFRRSDGMISFAHSEFTQGQRKTSGTLQIRGGEALLIKMIAGVRTEEKIAPPAFSLRDALIMQELMALGKAAPGVKVSSKYFESLPPFSKLITLENELVEISKKHIEGVETELYNWKSFSPDQGATMKYLIRSDGVVVRTDVVGMMSMRLEAESTAKSDLEAPDLIALSLIRPNRLIRNPRKLRLLDLRVELPKAFTAKRGYIQVLRRNGLLYDLRIVSPGLGIPGYLASLITPREEPPESSLSADPLIQSDHPEIIQASRKITAGSTDTRERVGRLVRHVYTSVRKAYRAELSNALDVHRSKVGDCTEHAVYFVALARAAKIPARTLTGLVYTDLEGGGFGGHAWAEVWIDGHWEPVDPTMNQVVADAAHIPLSEGIEKIGAIQDWWQIKTIEVLHQEHLP
jgi:hypothetical protein